MTYKEAEKINIGDTVIQKCHGYEMEVISKYKSNDWKMKNIVYFKCKTKSGGIMSHNHKELEVKKN